MHNSLCLFIRGFCTFENWNQGNFHPIPKSRISFMSGWKTLLRGQWAWIQLTHHSKIISCQLTMINISRHARITSGVSKYAIHQVRSQWWLGKVGSLPTRSFILLITVCLNIPFLRICITETDKTNNSSSRKVLLTGWKFECRDFKV